MLLTANCAIGMHCMSHRYRYSNQQAHEDSSAQNESRESRQVLESSKSRQHAQQDLWTSASGDRVITLLLLGGGALLGCRLMRDPTT